MERFDWEAVQFLVCLRRSENGRLRFWICFKPKLWVSLSTPLLHGPAILLQYLSYLMKSSTFSPLSVQIPVYLVVVFHQSSDAAALMVRMQKTEDWSPPWTQNKIKNIQKVHCTETWNSFSQNQTLQNFVSCCFWERFHPELLRVNCSFKCIQKPLYIVEHLEVL